MAGQGCPLQRRAWPLGYARLSLRAALAFALGACLLQPATLRAADVDLKLRIAWGGGEPRPWQGTIRVSEGTLSEFTTLGLEADAPGSIQPLDASTLRVFARTPHAYDGCDVRIQAPDDAMLIIELTADGNSASSPIEIPISKALQGFENVELDSRQNRLLAQRAPGDTLRVKLQRDSLIFAPSEKLELEVSPTGLPLAPSTSYLLSTTIQYARSDTELNRKEEEIRSTSEASLPATPLSLLLPSEEGVYDVRIALYPKRLTTTLVRGRPIAERKVQLVVLSPAQRVLPEAPAWKIADEFDPANPRWWERLPRWGSLRKLPAWSAQPIGSGPPGSWVHLERTWVELPSQGWQAYPLSITTPGRLHMLEIDYPSDLEQTLGVSLVEPNSAGQVVPIGLDSGIDVSAPRPGSPAKIQKLRIPFYPQTRSPMLLFTNRRADRKAVFGSIAIQTGPDELPRLELPPSGKAPQRMLAAYFDKPLFPENFSAGEGLDPITGRSLDDWQTFYDGSRRLVEYLQHSGYNAVVLTVACEGSAIYPSRFLEPTPKYDTGTFFESGQDPLRKDVLELVLRMCDRAGIQVVPAVQFASPLPELEEIRLLEPQQALGLEPIGADGRTWAARQGLGRGMGVYYNPLDRRVQQAIRHVVDELAARYGKHPAFAGVAVHSGPNTFSLLPDETCSYDATTLAQFQRDTSITLPSGAGAGSQQIRFLHDEGAKPWLAWRADKIASMLNQLHGDVQRHHPDAKLYVTSADLLTGRNIQQWLRPTLPATRDSQPALLTLGLDLPKLGKAGPVILPRPQRVVAGSSSLANSLTAASNQSVDLNTLFGSTGQAAAMHYHEPVALRLPAFDALSPFGAEKTHTLFVSQIPPAGDLARQRFVHSLATLDARTLIDGGWLLPLGQEEAIREIAQVYRRLPAEAFTTVESKTAGARTQPLTVRTLRRDGRTFFYLVNDSPWPLSAEVDWDSPDPLKVESYAAERESSIERQGARSTWTVQLKPYDLIGGEVQTPGAELIGWRVVLPKTVEEDLRERIRDLRLRANALRSPATRELLANPSFEQDLEDGEFPGWVHARGEGIVVEIDPAQGYRSPQSLHVVSRRKQDGAAPVVWLRSDSFPAPPTGRLSVVAWLRIDDPAKQPKLRLAIEGKLDGNTYYRRANVGASEDGKPLKALQKGWASYRFPLTDLPLSGLTDVRVGFDLMGEGEVWIDSVEVYDLWFEDNERDELLKNIAAADFQLSAGQVGDCQRFLDSFWPRFLQQFVPLDQGRIAATPDTARPPATNPPQLEKPQPTATAAPPTTPREASRTPVLDRVRNWWPRGKEAKTY